MYELTALTTHSSEQTLDILVPFVVELVRRERKKEGDN